MTVHADAELTRAYDDYRQLVDEANAGLHNNADGDISDDAGDRIVELGERVCNLPAKTLEGVAVKLRAAACWSGETPIENYDVEELCTLSALETVERLLARA